jgi:aspartyl-tRNA(Asn)/glutamyl-tRNA(Gln) amidotransferase subunit A
MGTANELSSLTITGAAELIARRQLSPVELIETVLTRIERLDAQLGAYILVMADAARQAARDAEAELTAGTNRGPLHGIPIALKDLYDVEGVPTTAGSKFYGKAPAAEDAPAVARLKQAGAVITGKLNMHEFAFGADSLNAHFGYCHNPWDTERIAGGSSGGSGVAVAADLCLGATGSDTGGSIRIPASVCGIVGLKPTRGLVSTRGLVPLSPTMDHAGPMTKSVRDAALMLSAMAGFDLSDPPSVERPSEDFTAELDRGLKGLRVGVPGNYFFDDTEPDVAAAVRKAADEIAALGATVSDVTVDMSAADGFVIEPPPGRGVPPLRGVSGVWVSICCAESYTFHRPFLPEHRDDYGPNVVQLIELTAQMPAAEYVAAQRAREQLTTAFERTLTDEVDLLLTPTTRRTAPTIEESLTREPGLAWNTWVFDLTSQPSISVPCGFDSKGLPIGLMLSGRKWSDAIVLRAAHAYEQATEWHSEKPDLSKVEAAAV